MTVIVSLLTNGVETERIELCPDEQARIAATTDDGTLVEWTEDGQASQSTPDNTWTVTARRNREIEVTATTDSTSRTVVVAGKPVGLAVEIPPGPHQDGYHVITAEPAMPSVTVQADGVGGGASGIGGTAVVSFVAGDCPPNGPLDLRTRLDLGPAGPGVLDLGDVVRGGGLGVRFAATVDGCPVSGSAGATIAGTNPDRAEVRALLPHRVLRAISCQESGCRQFDAPPDGGVSRCPRFGDDGGVGIMGLHGPSRDEVWNWRANVARGVADFETALDGARDYPDRVRTSDGFGELVAAFNDERLGQGRAALAVELPDLAGGDVDGEPGELERDAIRGYDGWFGTDRFGRPGTRATSTRPSSCSTGVSSSPSGSTRRTR